MALAKTNKKKYWKWVFFSQHRSLSNLIAVPFENYPLLHSAALLSAACSNETIFSAAEKTAQPVKLCSFYHFENAQTCTQVEWSFPMLRNLTFQTDATSDATSSCSDHSGGASRAVTSVCMRRSRLRMDDHWWLYNHKRDMHMHALCVKY